MTDFTATSMSKTNAATPNRKIFVSSQNCDVFIEAGGLVITAHQILEV
jgi:hypothetical protein